MIEVGVVYVFLHYDGGVESDADGFGLADEDEDSSRTRRRQTNERTNLTD